MAVIREIAPSGGEIPHFTVTKADGSVSFTTLLGDDDLIFGLGENVRGINKRGHLYRAWNMDDFSHTENKGGIYSSHNLLLFSGEQGVFGAYFDDPGAVTFDLGYSDGGKAVITSENGNLSVYLIESTTLTGLVREFRHLIGRSYIPPKWAMGYIQSRWGYASEDDLNFIVSEHRKRHIPLDNVCMDIDYMEDFKDFTWNPVHFPDLKATNARMKDEHIHLVPIIDAGIKQLTGDPIYDEGVQKDYFVKKADGSLFVGAVWPGRACFPDFLREDVRQWFGAKYHKLMDTGIEGFWNDMNEPALFYSTDSLENAFETAERCGTRIWALTARSIERRVRQPCQQRRGLPPLLPHGGRSARTPRQSAQPLRRNDDKIRRRRLPQLQSRPALSALQPLLLHRCAPRRRRVAG